MGPQRKGGFFSRRIQYVVYCLCLQSLTETGRQLGRQCQPHDEEQLRRLECNGTGEERRCRYSP
jgi:hypothetical protein